ncbi:hypothetical protein DXG03_004224 [Asterophora parasitica]|uniref:Uncharacterized protein n=1 Tax=Asterophora parasitica TaxID=117018 RepID=A0A9P7KFT1_9AGAR|nr:hypothetical protein DXG03_004224 [Asterophora parasitica]
MPSLTFTGKDFLNSELHPAYAAVSYRIETHSGFLGRKTTTLTPLSQSPYRGIPGEIDWRDKTFQIGDVKHNWSGLNRDTGGFFSSAKEWHWPSGRSYVVNYNNGEWTAVGHSWGSTGGAVFRLRRSHITTASEPATISFSQDIPYEDTVFLILVMIFSEAKREDKSQELREYTLAAAGG